MAPVKVAHVFEIVSCTATVERQRVVDMIILALGVGIGLLLYSLMHDLVLHHGSGHDPCWPEEVTYLVRPRLSPQFPPPLVPLLVLAGQAAPGSQSKVFAPRAVVHPHQTVAIKRVDSVGHPAYGQRSLVARKSIKGASMVIPYLGIIHASLLLAPTDDTPATAAAPTVAALSDPHEDSDYDLSLVRLSASDTANPFPGMHVSIGVDAAQAGNAARFVNDYRGVAAAPNAEFRLGRGEGGELRMEVWTLKAGVGKGDELLVSYGKGWWGSRR